MAGSGKPKRSRAPPWWKAHEQMAHLFEQLFRPLEKQILRDTRRRDIVGTLRQLDVGVIQAGEQRVKAFVEVQKRKKKVGLEDFGTWVYKLDTLGAKELVIVSEEGFAKSVVAHVKKLYPDRVQLGLLHPVEVGFIEKVNSTVLGVGRTLDVWWVASAFAQFADDQSIGIVPIVDTDAPVFGPASPMALIREMESQKGDLAAGIMHALVFDCRIHPLSYDSRPIAFVMLTAEKQRRIWDPKTRFFAYEGIYPAKGQRGIALISDFQVDLNRTGRLTMVLAPDPEGVSGETRVAGQLEFT